MSSMKPNTQENQTGALVHIVGLLTGFIGTFAFYFFSDDSYVKDNAAKASNWQASLMIYGILASLIGPGSWWIFLLFGLNFGFSALATKKALNGKSWSYPLSLNLFDVEENSEFDNYDGDAKNKIERIKTLYTRGLIDENEMEQRMEDELEYEYDKSTDNNKSKNIEFSRN